MSNTKIHKEKGKSNRYWAEIRINPDRWTWWSPRVRYTWEELFGKGSWARHCYREWRETGVARAERKRREAKIHLKDHLTDVWGEYYYWKHYDPFEEEDYLELRDPEAFARKWEEWNWWYKYCLEEE